MLIITLFVVSHLSQAAELHYFSTLETPNLEIIKDPLTSKALAANIYWEQVEKRSLLFTFETNSNVVKLTHIGMGENKYTDITELGDVTITFDSDEQSYNLSKGKYLNLGSFIYMRKDEDFFKKMSANCVMFAKIKVFSEIYNLEINLQGIAELLEQVGIVMSSNSPLPSRRCKSLNS